MKLFLPQQHGAWAMLIIPFWLGVAASEFMWQHIPFFLGWTLVYLGTYPFLLLCKGKKISFHRKWTLIYMIPGMIFLLVPLWARPSIIWFGVLMLPFFAINMYFSRINQERALLNDFIAIIIFSITGMATSFLAKESLGALEIKLFIFNVLFFVGSTFYVKTMIREKTNIVYKRISYAYHVLVPLVLLLFREWMVTAAFLPSLFRAVYFYGKAYSIKKIGMFEIANAALFFVIMLTAIYLSR